MNNMIFSSRKTMFATAAFSGTLALTSAVAAQVQAPTAQVKRGAEDPPKIAGKYNPATTTSYPLALPTAKAATTTSSYPAAARTAYSSRPAPSKTVSTSPAGLSTGSAAAIPHSAPATVTGNSAMDADFYTPLPEEKGLHLQVGHSAFIDTKHRLSRVYVSNPDVLNSYTASPNQVVLTAKQPGASSFIVWDEVGDTQVYMVFAETNVDSLSSAMKRAFPTEQIDVQGRDGRINLSGIVGTQATSDAVAKLAAFYGKDVVNQISINSSRIKQVRLKVRFAEVDRSRVTQLGINLFGILNGNGSNPTLVQSTTGMFPSGPSTSVGGSSASSSTSSTTVAGSTVAVSNPLNFFLYNFNHNVGATIQDLENKQVMHILAEPNITAMSGEKANFLAGGEFPFPVVQGGTAGGATAVSIIFKPFGVKLDFTPLVNQDGTIDLTVAPEVSALDYTNAVTISGFTVPALSTRRAQTRVALRDGQSFAISGLLDQRTTDILGRTPGIASVPILGALFRSKNINHTNSELIVIVTPEIVDPFSDHSEENKLPTSPVPLLSPQKFDQALPDSAKKSKVAK